MAKIKRITIEFEDEDFGNVPDQAPQFGEYGRYYPAFTAPQKAEHPCTYCKNNPKNNPLASGICSCALPDLWLHNNSLG